MIKKIDEIFTDYAALDTSTEILEAIAHISDDDRSPMDIWTAPSQAERVRIYKLVTSDGTPSTKFFWGARSTRWAPMIPLQEDFYYLVEPNDRKPVGTEWVIAFYLGLVLWAIVSYFVFWAE